MILLWIPISDLHFIHRRHSQNFVWIRYLLRKLLCLQPGSTNVRYARQLDRQTDRQTEFFLLVFSSKTYKTWAFIKRRDFFIFNHAITILSLFTYSVCDEKVKRKTQETNYLHGFIHVLNGVQTRITWEFYWLKDILKWQSGTKLWRTLGSVWLSFSIARPSP